MHNLHHNHKLFIFSDVLIYVSEHDSIVPVFENKMNRLHTTRSWHFLGLDSVYNGDYLPMDSTSNVIDAGNQDINQ